MDGNESDESSSLTLGPLMRNRASYRNRSPDDSTWQNTPALKAFFRCLETSGDSWSDSVGGINWTSPGNSSLAPTPMLFNAAGSVGTVQPVMGVNQTPTILNSGAWPAIDTQGILMMYAGRVNILDSTNCRFAIGDINELILGSNSQGLGMSNGPWHAAGGNGSGTAYIRVAYGAPLIPATFAWVSNGASIVFNSVPSVSFSTPLGTPAAATATLSGGTTGTVTAVNFSSTGSGYTLDAAVTITDGTNTAYATVSPGDVSLDSAYQGQDVVAYTTYQSGVGMTYVSKQLADPGSGTTILTAPYLTSPTNVAGPFTPYACMRTANVAFYGAALFVFESGLPTDLETGVIAMGGMWRAGQRYTYPRWMTLT